MTVQKQIVNAKREKQTGLVIETTLELRLFNDQGNLRDRIFMNAELQGDANSPDFIPFEELTKAQILQWTLDVLGEQAIAAKEQELIDREQARIDAAAQEQFVDGLPTEE
jgi:hypothetical protein